MMAHLRLPLPLLAEVLRPLVPRPPESRPLEPLPFRLPPPSRRLRRLARTRQPLVTAAYLELGFLQCNRQCLMSLALLRLCHQVLPLLAFLWPSSFCCIRQPLVCNRQPLVLLALLRLEHLGRLIASSELGFLPVGPLLLSAALPSRFPR